MFRRLINYCRQFGPDLWVLSIGWFVGAMGFAASIPFIAIYFHDQLNMSTTEIGVFFGAMAVVRAVFQAVGGELSDRMSRKTLLVYAQLLRAVAFVGLGIAIAFDLGFWWVGLGMTVNATMGAIYFPALNAMVSDLLPPEKRLDGYALTRAAGNLGWAAGPAIGGFMAETSYAYLFYISAVITVGSSLVFRYALKAPDQAKRQEAFRLSDLIAVKNDSNLAIHCMLCLALYLVVAQLIAPFSVYAVGMVGVSEMALGWLFALNGLLVGLAQIPVTRALSGFRFTSQLALGGLLYFVGYGALGFSGNYIFMVMIIMIVTSGEMAMSPPSLTITSRLAPEGQMGRYMGIFGFFTTGGWSLGPLYGGWFLDHFSDRPEIAWLLIASLALVASVGFVLFGRRLPAIYNRK
jgi:MFS family permease